MTRGDDARVGGDSNPEFEVSIERHRVASVVACIGEIDIVTSEQLQQAFEECLGSGPSQVVVDCKLVPFIDSSGIRALLSFAKTCGERAVEFRVIASDQLDKVAQTLGVREALRIS